MSEDDTMDLLFHLLGPPCDTYWGSHGCCLYKDHDGDCICDCAIEDSGTYNLEMGEYYEDPGVFNVGAPPYYGPDTYFYGEDAPVQPDQEDQ